MKKVLTLTLLLSFSLLFAQSETEWKYKMHFIDVKANIGDAILIQSADNFNMLIDAGYTHSGKNAVLPYLKDLNITHLDFIVASHYHQDHIGGIPLVVEYLTTDSIFAVYDRGDSISGKGFQNYYEAIKDIRKTIQKGDTIWINEKDYAACLASNGEGIKTDNENTLSVALHFKLDELDLFTAGDLTHHVERKILRDLTDMDVYKVSHHGSISSSSYSFLQKIRPQVSVVPVTAFRGLPHPDVIDRLIEHSDVYITRDNGNIVITYPSGGENKFQVITSDSLERYYYLD